MPSRESRSASTCIIDLAGMTCVQIHLRDLASLAMVSRSPAETDAEAARLLAAIVRDGAVSVSTEQGEPFGLLFAPPGLITGQVVLCISEADAKEAGL